MAGKIMHASTLHEPPPGYYLAESFGLVSGSSQMSPDSMLTLLLKNPSKTASDTVSALQKVMNPQANAVIGISFCQVTVTQNKRESLMTTLLGTAVRLEKLDDEDGEKGDNPSS
jgi:hypothetical protein